VSTASERAGPFDDDNGEGEGEAVRRGAQASPSVEPAEDNSGFSAAVEPLVMTLEDAEEAVMLEELEDFCTCSVCPLPFRSSS